MPTYEYRCEKCGELFEVRQKFADLPLTTHDTCGGHVNRLLSAPALQFKGSGFYITDYAKGGKSGSSESANGGKGKSEPSSKTESGSKSDAPAPATTSTPSSSDSSSKT